ncbi:MAG: IS3 family transposase [Rhodobacteraceae bacterium]|nr:IS3 family transposase [Paracoccaceae bacterium]
MLRDAELLQSIRTIHAAHAGHYGSPRVHGALRLAGERLGCKRVARLMRENQLRGTVADLYRSRAGVKAFFTSVPNRQLDVLAQAPDRVWVGDVTYLRISDAWRYLAVVLDKRSRRVLAWTLRRRRDVTLTSRALRLAVQRRRPSPGLIFHSDRGIEYAAEPFREQLRKLGAVQSMNRPRSMNDNAHMESFFHTMKSELNRKLRVTTDGALRRVIGEYMEYYNRHRGHTSLGNRSPVEFEALRC